MTTADIEYQRIVNNILDNGVYSEDRTGTGTLAVVGDMARFDVSKEFPILTTKQVFYITAWKEMLWMLSGDTSILPLLRQNVSIWSEWPHKAYCERSGETITVKEFEARLLTGEIAPFHAQLGPCYGHQWRKWKAADGRVIDQVSQAIETIKNNPQSRRIIIEGWNVGEVDEMAKSGLPPCHKTYQFCVKGDRLSLVMQQRSADVGAGLPFNWVNGAMFLHLMAACTGTKPYELIWQGVDVHLYSNHIEQLKEQMSRTPTECSPQFAIKQARASLFDYAVGDLALTDYSHQGKISLPIAV